MKWTILALPAVLLLAACQPYSIGYAPVREQASGPGSVSARYVFTAPTASLAPAGQWQFAVPANLYFGNLLAIKGDSQFFEDWESVGSWSGADPPGGMWWKDVVFSDMPLGSYHLAVGHYSGGDIARLDEQASGMSFQLDSALPVDAGQLEYDLGITPGNSVLSGRLYLNGSPVVKDNTSLSVWGATGLSGTASTVSASWSIPAGIAVDGRADFEIRDLPAGSWTLSHGYSYGLAYGSDRIPALQVALEDSAALGGLRVPIDVFQGDTQWKEDANAYRIRLRLTGSPAWNGDLALHIRDSQGRDGDIWELRYWLLPVNFDTGEEGDDPLEYYFISGLLEHGFYDFSLTLYGDAPGVQLDIPLAQSRFEMPSGWGSGYIPDDKRPLVEFNVELSQAQAQQFAN